MKNPETPEPTEPCMEYNIKLTLEYTDGTILERHDEFGPFYKVPLNQALFYLFVVNRYNQRHIL